MRNEEEPWEVQGKEDIVKEMAIAKGQEARWKKKEEKEEEWYEIK